MRMRMDNFFKTQRLGLCKHFLFPLLPHFKVSRWGSGHGLFKKEVRLCASPQPETARQTLSCQNRTPSRLQLKFIKFSTSVCQHAAHTHAGSGRDHSMERFRIHSEKMNDWVLKPWFKSFFVACKKQVFLM